MLRNTHGRVFYRNRSKIQSRRRQATSDRKLQAIASHKRLRAARRLQATNDLGPQTIVCAIQAIHAALSVNRTRAAANRKTIRSFSRFVMQLP